MIIINPLSGTNKNYLSVTNNSVTTYDYDINLAFANKLSTALTAEGEKCLLSRSGNFYPEDTDYKKLLTNNDVTVIFNIKCLADISSSTSGFSIECDIYNALVATINESFVIWGSKAVYPRGYKIEATTYSSSSPTSATYSEITLGLGFISNSEDLAKLVSSDSLDSLVKQIVDASYAPATRNTQKNTSCYVPDPYFYGETDWSVDESTVLDSDSAIILQDKINNIPIKLLRVQTTDAVRINPYVWKTTIDSDVYNIDSTVIFSYRFKQSSGGISCSVGLSSHSYVYEDYQWHTVNFETTPTSTYSALNLSFPASTYIDVTAVWVAKASVVGSVDDPITEYSIYPPAYQPVTTVDLASIAASNSTVTTATSLLGRAQDTLTNTTSQIQTLLNSATLTNSLNSSSLQAKATSATSSLSGTAALSSAMSKVDQLGIKSKDFIQSASSVATLLNKMSSSVTSKFNVSTLNLQTSVLTTALGSVSRTDKKTNMLNVINTVKGVSNAVTLLTKTDETKKKEADDLAAKVKARLEAKGSALSTS